MPKAGAGHCGAQVTASVFTTSSCATRPVCTAPWTYKSGGDAQTMLNGNTFIRPYDIERGTVFGGSGEVKTGGRTLAYFIAHEVTHAMTADRVGRCWSPIYSSGAGCR